MSQSQGDDPFSPFARIFFEHLKLNDETLFSYDDATEQLILSNGNYQQIRLGSHKSNLVMYLSSLRENSFRNFRDQISQLQLLHLEPGLMLGEYNPDEIDLANNGSNFPSWWFNRISGENSHLLPSLYERLNDVIEGFRGITLQDHRAGKRFAALIDKKENGSGAFKYGINELSDGERVLLVLYSLLYGTEPGSHILCLDEPDNFVSLPELHAWLMWRIQLASATSGLMPHST